MKQGGAKLKGVFASELGRGEGRSVGPSDRQTFLAALRAAVGRSAGPTQSFGRAAPGVSRSVGGFRPASHDGLRVGRSVGRRSRCV